MEMDFSVFVVFASTVRDIVLTRGSLGIGWVKYTTYSHTHPAVFQPVLTSSAMLRFVSKC